MCKCKIVTVLVYLSVLFFCCACEDPCNLQLTVDITNGSQLPNGTIDHNGLRYSPKQYFNVIDEVEEIQTRGCICSVKTCMRKCCPMGQGLENNKCVLSEEDIVKEFNPKIYLLDKETSKLTVKNHFGIIHDHTCRDGTSKITLNPNLEQPDDAFYLQEDGRLYLPDLGLSDLFLGPKDYCLDAFIDEPSSPVAAGELPSELAANWTTRYLVYVCTDNPQTEPDIEVFTSLSVGLAISIPFLLATFLVYAFIPELRNLHGKTIMNYTAGLILAFISLVFIQQRITYNEDKTACLLMAFSTYFFFMVSFFWLNIMCIDVWLTFRKYRDRRIGGRESERRRYIIYCLYGWGVPIPLTALLAFMQFKEDLSSVYIRPEFGQLSCWFYDWKSNLLYFYVPVLILVVFNLILFSITSYKILMIKRETTPVLNTPDNTRNDQYTNEKQRFFVYLKLFIFMGVNWITEVLSFIFGGSAYIWITTDLLNTFLGVFIFFTFVWKKHVKRLAIKRYNTLRYGSSESDTQRSRYRSNASSMGRSSEYSKRTTGTETTTFMYQ